MKNLFFDSHCHTTDPRLSATADFFAENLADFGLSGYVEIGAGLDELDIVLNFAEKHKNVFATAGVHPLNTYKYDDAALRAFLTANKDNPKLVAVGECGLDYYHIAEVAPFGLEQARLDQIKIFEKQIELANEFKKSLVVHTRDAFDDTLEILKRNKSKLKNGVLIHCTSFGAEEVKKLLGELDAYFAFGGAITYKKNIEIMKDAIRAVPLNRLLLETDAPYLAPEPVRGKVNTPEFIKYPARVMADALNLTVDEIAELTTANAKAFYRI
ncbi:MAG: TatD family hydrolase [Christensenellaceae bacterium]|jgi:TatD DNase family protein|nr:TatD family hydrolase [Christensenellaceae bacterium]